MTVGSTCLTLVDILLPLYRVYSQISIVTIPREEGNYHPKAPVKKDMETLQSSNNEMSMC